MGWEDPSESDFFQIKDHVGSLVLVAVNGYEANFPTSMGPSQCVRCEIAVVDGSGAGKRYSDALLFNKKIVPQLRNSIGSTILARIGLGEPRPGQSAPYELKKAGPGDAEKANAYVAQYGDVEAKPLDQSQAGGQGYAPDQPQWKVQNAQQAQRQAPQQQGYPTPPAMPQTYTTVPASDEAPF